MLRLEASRPRLVGLLVFKTTFDVDQEPFQVNQNITWAQNQNRIKTESKQNKKRIKKESKQNQNRIKTESKQNQNRIKTELKQNQNRIKTKSEQNLGSWL